MVEEELGSEAEVEGRVDASKGKGWDRGSSELERKLGGPCRLGWVSSRGGGLELRLWWFEGRTDERRILAFK